jgi:hypothetical protein
MEARFIKFGQIEIEGQRYEYDLVIEKGTVRRRKKKPSKPFREQFGHTPLSAQEVIPWGGKQLIVGTGAYGRLPIMPDVYDMAHQRQVEIVAVPTEEACHLLQTLPSQDAYAILHVTC